MANQIPRFQITPAISARVQRATVLSSYRWRGRYTMGDCFGFIDFYGQAFPMIKNTSKRNFLEFLAPDTTIAFPKNLINPISFSENPVIGDRLLVIYIKCAIIHYKTLQQIYNVPKLLKVIRHLTRAPSVVIRK